MKPLVETWKHKTGRIGRSTIVLLVYNVLFGGVEGLREGCGERMGFVGSMRF